MAFVYLHAAWFMLWIFVLAVEPFPFGLLTMLVSLEAIFLSTFVMVSQNRQGEMAARQAAHDHVIVRAIAEKVGVDVDGS